MLKENAFTCTKLRLIGSDTLKVEKCNISEGKQLTHPWLERMATHPPHHSLQHGIHLVGV